MKNDEISEKTGYYNVFFLFGFVCILKRMSEKCTSEGGLEEWRHVRNENEE